MKESLETIKAFFSGWGSIVAGIVGVVVILFAIYLILKVIIF